MKTNKTAFFSRASHLLGKLIRAQKFHFWKAVWVFLALIPVMLLFHLILVKLPLEYFRIKELAVEDTDFTDIYYHTAKNAIVDQSKDIVIINSGSLPVNGSRAALSEVIDKISEYAPKAIGIDIYFIEPKDSIQDNRLIRSVIDHEAILGDRVPYPSSFRNRIPRENFANIDLPATEGQSIRNYNNFVKINDTTKQLSFARALFHKAYRLPNRTVKEVIPLKYSSLGKGFYNALHPVEETDSIPLLFPAIEASDILSSQPDSSCEHLIKDKIVLIGRLGGPDMYNFYDGMDKHRVPTDFSLVNRKPLMPGVVVHANALQMLINDDFLYEIDGPVYYLLEFSILFVFLMFFIAIDVFIRHIASRIIIELTVLIVAIYYLIALGVLLMNYNIHFNVGKVLLALALLIEFKIFALNGYEFLVEKSHQKKQHNENV